MGMIETASRIIKRFGQAGQIERAGEPTGPDYAPQPGVPTFHDVTVGVVEYDNDLRDGTFVQMNDLRVFVSVDGLDIVPDVSDRLHIGSADYTIVRASYLGPDGVARFHELQVRR